MVSFSSVTSVQGQSVLLGYEISMTAGFAGLQDFNDGQFCFLTSFQ